MHFTGQPWDSDSGLTHFWFRQYSMAVGRWMTPDPAGTAVASAADPQSWNRYAYVGNSPVVYDDDWGLVRNFCTNAGCILGEGGGSCAFVNPSGQVTVTVDGVDAPCDVANSLLSTGAVSSININITGQFPQTIFAPGGGTCELQWARTEGTEESWYECTGNIFADQGAANNALPGVPKPPNPILQNCPGPTSPPPTGTEQDLEGLAALSHVIDMAGVTTLGAGLMVGSPIAAGAACFYSGGLMCVAALEAAPAGTVGGYYLMKNGAQQLVALIPNKKGC
jgi:RHS repeat-associated protein